ncbi:cap-specific mRNA (nucleoside-2'-O-)-methyltransferase 2 [Plutella xylostella]|uniref:cap-specific mRNA (nucleoside-2'-O-)-methyltransferase 2 n=1 Tax=Plutella xylostella TaxID=51655 RepID=UPI002032A5D3|nr:cap-specific mRNA (nucleoside-2'-O-)-methyltransferase 2 [Plutella xylostella]
MQYDRESFLQSRSKNARYNRPLESDADELDNLFNKKFKFRFSSEWRLPDAGAWFAEPPWTVKELSTLKSRLNFHKSQLNDFNIEEWSAHTRRRNPAGDVSWRIRSQINPEFLTQAWTKFYECAYTYNIIAEKAKSSRKMVSLHLCEAPGAFIASLNHYLKSHYPNIEWQWIASTLNPYYEGNSPSNMISDDRFMFHTLDHWEFGRDNTGNLMDWENSQSIIRRAKELGEVLLVTADGSIDCLQKPDAQEEVTSPLHYCEIVTALQALSEGGTLIFKLFTLFEHSTVSLMYLINHLFEEVNIYKPVTSRQGNSEVYAVCLKYRGSGNLQPYLPVLRSGYGSDLYCEKSLFSLQHIPQDFLKQIEECAYYFCSIQCQVINNNLQAYLTRNSIAFQVDVKKIKSWVATAFLAQYELRPLPCDQEIMRGALHQEDHKLNTNPRYHRGSYSERQSYTGMTLKEKCKNLGSFLHTDIFLKPEIFINEPVRWVEMYEGGADLPLAFTYGKPLQAVNSSKFIFVPIYKLYLQIMGEPEFKDTVVSHDSRMDTCTDLAYLQCDTEDWRVLSFPVLNLDEDYATYEKKCFATLLENLEQLSAGDSLFLRNFNTLTHFNISVLFILCKKCFEKLGLTSDNGIVLHNLVNKNACSVYLNKIKNECDSVRSDAKDVLSALPVQITNSEQFFNNIVFYNNTFYRNKCVKYLCAIEQRIN